MTERVDESCDYCGLPTATRRRGGALGNDRPVYCCLGCSIAASVAGRPGAEGDARWTLARLGLAAFFTMNVSVFSMALWTGDLYADDTAPSPLAAPLEDLFRYLCLLLSLPVAWLLGAPFAVNAVDALRRGQSSTDLLILLGVAAAFVYSAVSVVRDAGHLYFEVGCIVLVMMTLGRWIEAQGKLRTSDALDRLDKLLPDKVRLVRGGRELCVDRANLRVGDRFHVAAGERFAADGRIARGQAAIDEQTLSGESRPAVKEPGDAVYAGTLNLDGDLLVEVTTAADDAALSRLIRFVHEARLAKGFYQRLADRVAAEFVPVVTAIAIGAFVWHWRTLEFEAGLLSALAVLLIACPCALGLATPLAVWAALGRAAEGQTLFRSGDALERLAGVKAIAFDKTGTLTAGVPQVCGLIAADPELRDEAMSRAATLAAGSTHPLASALRQAFPDVAIDRLIAGRTAPGRGIAGAWLGDCGQATEVALGSPRFMDERGLSMPDLLSSAIDAAARSGRLATCLGWDGAVRAVFTFDESVRPAAHAAIQACRDAGLEPAVLTGDHGDRGRALGAALGVDVEAELLPEDKVSALAALRRRFGPVAMVGDGVNDAPALAAADVGLAMACGADVSRESADVCLLGNDLLRVAWSVRLARRAVRTIRQNLFWAFAYNVVGIGLAAVGALNPIWAGAAMLASSGLVIGNSLRLQSWTDANGLAWQPTVDRSEEERTTASEGV